MTRLCHGTAYLSGKEWLKKTIGPFWDVAWQEQEDDSRRNIFLLGGMTSIVHICLGKNMYIYRFSIIIYEHWLVSIQISITMLHFMPILWRTCTSSLSCSYLKARVPLSRRDSPWFKSRVNVHLRAGIEETVSTIIWLCCYISSSVTLAVTWPLRELQLVLGVS